MKIVELLSEYDCHIQGVRTRLTAQTFEEGKTRLFMVLEKKTKTSAYNRIIMTTNDEDDAVEAFLQNEA
jgi:hypothetical protein